MKEEDAKTKWCPMVRCSNNLGSAANKWDNLIGKEVMCIASRCMMWRISKEAINVGYGEMVGEEGYCGMGGKS